MTLVDRSIGLPDPIARRIRDRHRGMSDCTDSILDTPVMQFHGPPPLSLHAQDPSVDGAGVRGSAFHRHPE